MSKNLPQTGHSESPQVEKAVGGFSGYRTLIYVFGFVVFSTCSYIYLLPLVPHGTLRFSPSSQPGSPKILPTILHADELKRDAVVEAFKHAWRGYERDAMGADEYHPISHQGSNLSSTGGIGYTVVDAIDTIFLMGLDAEYSRARFWVKRKLRFDREGTFNTFETTIRVLGGLLSIHNLTGDKLYLKHAVDLADRMVPTFDTKSGLPLSSVNLAKSIGIPDQYSPNLISTAEAATLQLEFKYLAELTHNESYWRKVENVMAVINKAKLSNNLVPIYMNHEDGTFTHSDIRLGSRGDSYYEYLIKQYLQTGSTESIYKKMYEDAMQGVHDNLVQKTMHKKMTYIGELIPQRTGNGETSWNLNHKQDHLVCFLAGSLMLGATTSGAVSGTVSVPPLLEELSPRGQRDWKTGVDLLETCMSTHETATGFSPEIAMFKTPGDGSPDSDRDWYIKGSLPGGPATYDARYMLRPETVESLFIAWRLTGDVRYRKYAWAIFSSIEKHCRLENGGYATALDVDTIPVRLDDKQETFFLSETLKYLYLTFANSSVLPLHDYVFNTEAHPLPIFKPTIKPGFV